MKEIIGQTQAKTKLDIFSKAFSKTNRLPFLLLTGERGGGKTNLARTFRKNLRRSDGTTPKIMEVNASSIKNMQIFATQLYPVWRDEKAILFIDEIHELANSAAGKQILTYFLTILEKDKNPIRRVTYNDREAGEIELVFDFTKMGIILATTEQHMLPEPLLDRLNEVALVPYTDEELFEIFKLNIPKEIKVPDLMQNKVVKVFRGHPRDAVSKADELKDYMAAMGKTYLTDSVWSEFMGNMGVYEYDLNQAEIRLLSVLGKTGTSMSLQALSASTGYSRGVIQQRYEKSLMAKGLLEIDGKRHLTNKGRTFFLKHKVK